MRTHLRSIVALVSLVFLLPQSATAREGSKTAKVKKKDRVNARVELARPDPAVDADADGHLHLKEHNDRSAIHVHLRHLDRGATYTVKISRGAATETLGEVTIAPPREPKPPHCFEATLDGDQEVPPVTTEATGVAKFKLTGRDRSRLRYQVKVEGLSGPATEAHIHSGAVGADGPVLITLDAATLKGSVEVTPEQAAEIASGNTYVNVHTEAHPDGEIRGQLVLCKDPKDDHGNDDEARGGSGGLKIDTKHGDQLPFGAASVADLVGATVSVQNAGGAVVLSGTIESLDKPAPAPRCFEADLTGAQEVPAVTTAATATARFNIEGRDRSRLHYRIRVKGSLSGPLVAAHIHLGPPGEDGPVVHPLDHEALEGRLDITEEDRQRLEAGMYYVNLHTAANPDGEIRGQIGACGRRGPGRHGGPGGEGPPEGEDDAAGGGSLSLWDAEPFFEDFVFDMEGRHDAPFRRGDVNSDGALNISDPIGLLAILFLGELMPACADALDADDDGRLNITDPIALLGSLFQGSGPLPPPGRQGVLGFDGTSDALFCEDTE